MNYIMSFHQIVDGNIYVIVRLAKKAKASSLSKLSDNQSCYTDSLSMSLVCQRLLVCWQIVNSPHKYRQQILRPKLQNVQCLILEYLWEFLCEYHHSVITHWHCENFWQKYALSPSSLSKTFCLLRKNDLGLPTLSINFSCEVNAKMQLQHKPTTATANDGF